MRLTRLLHGPPEAAPLEGVGGGALGADALEHGDGGGEADVHGRAELGNKRSHNTDQH